MAEQKGKKVSVRHWSVPGNSYSACWVKLRINGKNPGELVEFMKRFMRCRELPQEQEDRFLIKTTQKISGSNMKVSIKIKHTDRHGHEDPSSGRMRRVIDQLGEAIRENPKIYKKLLRQKASLNGQQNVL